MINLFKKKSAQRKTLVNITAAFAIIDEFVKRGLIHYQVKDRILLIEETLAIIQLRRGADGFKRFLEQVAMFQNFRLLQEAYETRRIALETEAVRQARSVPGRVVTETDVNRIRQHAREQLAEIDPSQLQDLITDSFDIMVIRADAPSASEATEENGQLLALGHYDIKKEHLEMALYDDVKHNLEDKEEES